MSDKTLEELLKEIEPNFNSHIEKGTIEMSIEYYNLLEERMIRLLNENKQLKEKIDILLEDNNQLEEIRIKAIEEIKEHSEMTDLQICGIENVLAFRGSATKLLEILGDKENE